MSKPNNHAAEEQNLEDGEQAENKQPSWVQALVGGLKSKGGLQAANSQLTQELEQKTEKIAELEQTVQTLSTQLEQIKTAFEEASEKSKQLEQNQEDVTGKSTALLSQLGFNPSSLPEKTETQESTLEQLQQQLTEEKNPRTRFKLQQKINAKRKAIL